MPPLVSEDYAKARRDQIVQAALECFVAKGFAHTTMQDIFAASGLSAGAVYNYFRSKDDIVVAIAEESLGRSARLVGSFVQASPRPLDALIDFFFRGLARDDAVVRMGSFDLDLFAEAARDPRLAEVLQAQSRSLLDLVGDVVRREQENGRVRPELSPTAVAQIVIVLWYGVLLGRVADPGADLEAYAGVIDAAFHGGIGRE